MSGNVVKLRVGRFTEERRRLLADHGERLLEVEVAALNGQLELEERVMRRAQLLVELFDINDRFPPEPS